MNMIQCGLIHRLVVIQYKHVSINFDSYATDIAEHTTQVVENNHGKVPYQRYTYQETIVLCMATPRKHMTRKYMYIV